MSALIEAYEYLDRMIEQTDDLPVVDQFTVPQDVDVDSPTCRNGLTLSDLTANAGFILLCYLTSTMTVTATPISFDLLSSQMASICPPGQETTTITPHVTCGRTSHLSCTTARMQ